jgi:hypothetical protein
MKYTREDNIEADRLIDEHLGIIKVPSDVQWTILEDSEINQDWLDSTAAKYLNSLIRCRCVKSESNNWRSHIEFLENKCSNCGLPWKNI